MPFYLLKVEDGKHQKFLVRAKHSLRSPDTACQSVRQEILEICDCRSLPLRDVRLFMLGGGRLRWNDDASVSIVPSTGSGNLGALDAGGLAASLLCQTLAVQLESADGKSAVMCPQRDDI